MIPSVEHSSSISHTPQRHINMILVIIFAYPLHTKPQRRGREVCSDPGMVPVRWHLRRLVWKVLTSFHPQSTEWFMVSLYQKGSWEVLVDGITWVGQTVLQEANEQLRRTSDRDTRGQDQHLALHLHLCLELYVDMYIYIHIICIYIYIHPYLCLYPTLVSTSYLISILIPQGPEYISQIVGLFCWGHPQKGPPTLWKQPPSRLVPSTLLGDLQT